MTSWDFAPTHVVPRAGLPAWEAPDVSRPTMPLDPLLPVQLLDRQGDWAQVLCVNGWSAWVDGRLLVAVPADPPAAGQPPARTADPRPLLARADEALGRYRRAAQELADGRVDGETFRARTRGLRVGMVVDGESVWLYDAEHERWVHCDGRRLTTLAASADPAVRPVRDDGGPVAADAAGPADPTRVAGADRPGEPARQPPASAGGTARAAGADAPPPTRVVTGNPPADPDPGPDPAAPPPTRVVGGDGRAGQGGRGEG